jgi:CDP-diacylglycerol--glycerol-3-phosphate 3-phosphatidyltransferase
VRKQSLPNVITVSRLLVVPFGFYVHGALRDGHIPGPLSLFLLIWLIGSDFLDGILARRWHAESDFGRLVDPFIDKTFLATTLVVYGAAVDNTILWAVVVLRLVPDAMTFLLSLAEAQARRIKGSAFWGKRKTEVDFVALLIGYTPLLLFGDTSYYRLVIAVLMASTVLGFVAFGFYLRRFLTSNGD